MPLPSTMTPIATNTLTATATDVTFSSIPQGYTDLIVVMDVKGSANLNITFQLNSDTGTNYSRTVLYGTGSAAGSATNANYTGSVPLNQTAYVTTNFGFNAVLNFQNYSNTTTYKTILGRINNANNGTETDVYLWRSTSAINTIKFTGSSSLAIGSTFTLYGIKAA